MLSEAEKQVILAKFERFARKHKEEYPDWFEGVITAEGEVIAATISHIETLIELSDMTRDEVWEAMPITEMPIYWLSNLVHAVPVYDTGYLHVEMNEKQRFALSLLINKKMVANSAF